ncbi:HAD family hydrolase [Sphingobacterium sp. LRF_L2]|uniref:HAD family hydrolase n=1 Tax=Sphingobacterium sp. LRF_L2 TaxID=3369421 RepID=UPI003F5F0C57
MDNSKSVYVFEIDDVLYPKRDYLLQVYYLFSNFVEYSEARPLAASILDYMKLVFEDMGEDAVLEKTLDHFGLDSVYGENYERLKANANLPLKLFLKPNMKKYLLALFDGGKNVGILTSGNPVEQLNKLKHMDWEELTSHLTSLKVFFIEELKFRNIDPIDYIVEEYGVSKDDISVIRDELS